MLTGVSQFIVVLILGIIAMSVLGSGFSKGERRFLWYGFFAHVVGTLALVMVVEYIYKGGDMWVYHMNGLWVADRVLAQSSGWEALVSLLLGGAPRQLSFVYGAGSSTGIMSGVAGVFALLWGDSFLATSLALSFFAFAGQIGFYLAFRANLPMAFHKRAIVCSLLIPSVVFWTGGLVKEAIAMGGLGLAVYGLSLLVNRARIVRAVLLIVVGGALVGLIKSYILFPLAVAASIWFFMNLSVTRGKVFKIRFWHVLAGGLVSIAAIAMLGTVYEQYAVENVAEDAARLQGAYRQIDAGSTYELGDPSARTLPEQLQYAPLAFVSALFRPFIFEVHNATSLFNAGETTLLLLLVLYLVRLHGPRELFARATSSPFLVFLAVFVFLFATAVGLAAPNLGTLSRYRVPCFPAFWLFLMLLVPVKRAKPQAARLPRAVQPIPGDRISV